jgi:hypothetical protein
MLTLEASELVGMILESMFYVSCNLTRDLGSIRADQTFTRVYMLFLLFVPCAL